MPFGPARIRLRSAVGARERSIAAGAGLYLSLYDNEIDARADALWSRWNPVDHGCDTAPLEPTDAALFTGADGTLWVLRGAAATFPLYWNTESRDPLHFTTVLPVLPDVRLSRTGLVSAAAAAAVHGSYEPNGFVATPLTGWRRVRRAGFLQFAGGRLADEGLVALPWDPSDQPRAAVAARVRGALDAYRRSQTGVTASLLEVSGGFDSTLAAAVASRDRMQGVSVVFPFYEFRFEREVQQATADFLRIPRTEIDGLDLFPYSPSDLPARFDEPSVYMTGIRHAEHVARFAAECGAQRIYTGHGGDQCFSTNLLEREALVAAPPGSGPFSPRAWHTVKQAIATMRDSPWSDRRLGTFVYDARADVWIKEAFGATLRTPFTDREVIRSALEWSRWCQRHNLRPNKTILAEAAGDLLPDAILTRRGKVAYDGVWARAYARHAGHIAAVFARAADLLDQIGISVRWLERRVEDLEAWRPRSDREVLAIYAIACWLNNWGLTRPGDVQWSA